MSTLFRYVFCLLLAQPVTAAICVSAGSGDWTNASTWSCGRAPLCGDSIVIQASHTVNIVAQDYNPCALRMVLTIEGTLQFTSAGKLEFDCLGRVYVFGGGKIIAANGVSGNSNAFMQCNSTWWNAGAGTYIGPGCLPPNTPGCAKILPVKLVNFQGGLCNLNEICLTWQTESERNHAYFELQRAGDDLKFITLERISGSGEDRNLLRTYHATDEAPLPGTNYYRLQQVDNDRSVHFSELIAVQASAEARQQITVVPSPNNGAFMLEMQHLIAGEQGMLTILDQLGQELYRQPVTAEQAGTHIPVITNLSTGIYYCAVVFPGRILFAKLPIEKP